MEFIQFSQVARLLGLVTILFVLCKVVYSWWIMPKLMYRKLKANGFDGPTPKFPLGNINEMKEELMMKRAPSTSSSPVSPISHDIHTLAFPYFATWQKLHGKVFIYWLGTEPFVYIADPEFIKKMSAGVMGKSWGKPTVFKMDRKAMFGKGLVMVEGDEWVRHRHVITPAFTAANLKGMASVMADSARHMLDRWAALVNSGNPEIDVESEIIGHETTALALTWTLLLLAQHPEWQTQLREEIKQVMGDGEIDPTRLVGLRKMGWVMNEVLRLYSPAPNVQRQAREDIQVDDLVIPSGTNMWIDVVSMHHDKKLWGEDVNEFKPERFKDDIHGGCKHKMGYLPFGFGGRMCIGRNLSVMEYKIVLSSILTRFTLSISPNYIHCPSIMLSLRPTLGLPIVLQPL